jgi:translation initiation factor 3 subunit B
VKEDHGYYIWSFQGRILKRINLKNFIQFLWRPRPASLLSEEKCKEIKKSLKKFYPQFEAKDRMRLTRASKELVEKRAKLREVFEEYRSKKIVEWQEQKKRRIQLRNSKFFFLLLINFPLNPYLFFVTTDIDTDEIENDPDNCEEETVEFLVKEEITNLE